MVEQTTDVSSQSHQSDLKAECVAGGWGGNDVTNSHSLHARVLPNVRL